MTHIVAKREGYYEGYKHGLKGTAFDPNPKRAASISDQTCLHIYLVAYEEGYDRAKSDRLLLLSGR